MATFISLINWTEQGVRNYKDTIERSRAAAEMAREMGGSLTTYWTLGQYDIVAIIEMPEPESMVAFALRLGALGNVRTHTLRAFGPEEMERIIARAAE